LTVSAFQSLQSSFSAAALLCSVSLACQAASARDQGRDQDPELQLGQEVFNELKARAEIIESSPLYIARSHPVSREAVAAWPMSRQLWNNLIATLGPVL
jgi:hypothetical protein